MDDVSPTSIGAAILSSVTTVAGLAASGVRRASRAFDELEKRVAKVEERLTKAETHRAGRIANDARKAETIEEIRELVDRLETALAAKLDSEEFFVQLRQDQDRWQKLERSLGHIEGILSVVNEKLRLTRR